MARLFCLGAKFHKDIVFRAAKKIVACFFLKHDITDVNLGYCSYINVSNLAKWCVKYLTQGPQKIFGGPHAARRPHFGHPCKSILKLDNSTKRFSNLGMLNLPMGIRF